MNTNVLEGPPEGPSISEYVQSEEQEERRKKAT